MKFKYSFILVLFGGFSHFFIFSDSMTQCKNVPFEFALSCIDCDEEEPLFVYKNKSLPENLKIIFPGSIIPELSGNISNPFPVTQDKRHFSLMEGRSLYTHYNAGETFKGLEKRVRRPGFFSADRVPSILLGSCLGAAAVIGYNVWQKNYLIENGWFITGAAAVSSGLIVYLIDSFLHPQEYWIGIDYAEP